jgi:type I restriction enzyme, S subunit
LAEQRRVVARIEELAAQIHEARTLRHQAAEEAEALARVAFTKRFAVAAKQDCIRPLGETFAFRNDLIRPTDGVRGKVRFVGLQHVESHTGHRTGEDSLLAEELTGRKFKFSRGEIVYGYLRPYLNKVWIADCEGVCSVDQYVLKARASVADACYLAYFMRSGRFLDEAIERTHNLMLPRLRSELLKGIEIPVPPLPEQRRIVAELDALQSEVDALKRLQAETAAELDALLPSILDRAFKGEL